MESSIAPSKLTTVPSTWVREFSSVTYGMCDVSPILASHNQQTSFANYVPHNHQQLRFNNPTNTNYERVNTSDKKTEKVKWRFENYAPPVNGIPQKQRASITASNGHLGKYLTDWQLA